MVSREALSTAVRKCVAIVDVSLSQTEGNTQLPAAQALQLFREFLSEMERIDAQAHTGTGTHVALHFLHIIYYTCPCPLYLVIVRGREGGRGRVSCRCRTYNQWEKNEISRSEWCETFSCILLSLCMYVCVLCVCSVSGRYLAEKENLQPTRELESLSWTDCYWLYSKLCYVGCLCWVNIVMCLLHREGLVPPQTLPLHEVCYFNNGSSLRKVLPLLSPSLLSLFIHTSFVSPSSPLYLASLSSSTSSSSHGPHQTQLLPPCEAISYWNHVHVHSYLFSSFVVSC